MTADPATALHKSHADTSFWSEGKSSEQSYEHGTERRVNKDAIKQTEG